MDAVNAGTVTHVAGREVWAKWGAQASTWQNGSVSVQVRGTRVGNSNKQGQVWVKEGQSVTFTTRAV